MGGIFWGRVIQPLLTLGVSRSGGGTSFLWVRALEGGEEVMCGLWASYGFF